MEVRNETLEVVGGQVPLGEIRVSGAKNSAIKLLAAAMLTDDRAHLHNFPTELVDVLHKVRFMEALGIEVEVNREKSTVTVMAKEIRREVLTNYTYPFRTTYLLVPGQLRHNGVARIPYPGGCRIGERKYDLHVMVWERMGCRIIEKSDHIEVSSSRLKPSVIDFPLSTVGGTESALLCASIINGETVIKNAYVTPEILNLIEMLRAMGAQVDVVGNSLIRVFGNDSLHGVTVSVIPDRIEALTWIIYSTIAKGNVVIEDVPFEAMEVPLIHLKEAGIDLFRNTRDVYICPNCFRRTEIQPFELACGTYPGVISDMQPFFVLLGLFANGRSRIIDYRYPERTAYLEELNKLCDGKIRWDNGEIIVDGPVRIKGADVTSTDLRGSMALVLAGLLGEGKTRVRNVSMALRGYNNLLHKLNELGISAQIS